MLLNLHVKNFALIDDANVSFGEGFNVFTGETGAGKSILIDAVSAALGVKTSKNVIRAGCEYAWIELVFSLNTDELTEKMALLDIEPDDDGMVIITKTIHPNRSLNKINDVAVTAAKLREATAMLVHVHGQNEHTFLFKKSAHLKILDDYCKAKSEPIKKELAEVYRTYCGKKAELEDLEMDERSRLREIDLLKYEIDEIERAALKEGEEEQLQAEHNKFKYSKRIAEGLSSVKDALGSDSYDNVSDKIAKSTKAMASISDYDDDLRSMNELLVTIESLISDLMGDVDSYLDSLAFAGDDYARIENRLDEIRNIQAKYGRDYEAVMEALEERRDRLEILENLDKRKKKLTDEIEELTDTLEELSGHLSELRREESFKLIETIRMHLIDLNFLDVQFSMEFERLPDYTANGYDEAEFYISTNPGQDLMPLGQVASGGELSRVMLAIKTVLADTDEIQTLIFDEIDAGISGRTAQKVSEKLSLISQSRQVICITHLAQIAAMADRHFMIQKDTESGKTSTHINKLDDEQIIEELARILGGVSITDAVMENAREMKELADSIRKR